MATGGSQLSRGDTHAAITGHGQSSVAILANYLAELVSDAPTDTPTNGCALPAVAISGDASIIVAFLLEATNLFAGDTNRVADVFVRNRCIGTTTQATLSRDGRESDRPTMELLLPADGCFVLFATVGSTLVSDDTNRGKDVFMRDTLTGTTERVSVATKGIEVTGGSGADIDRFYSFSGVVKQS